jgi:hypothetical protein
VHWRPHNLSAVTCPIQLKRSERHPSRRRPARGVSQFKQSSRRHLSHSVSKQRSSPMWRDMGSRRYSRSSRSSCRIRSNRRCCRRTMRRCGSSRWSTARTATTCLEPSWVRDPFCMSSNSWRRLIDVDMCSSSPKSYPWLKPHIEQTFARLKASLLEGRDQSESCACLTNAESGRPFNAEVIRVTVGKFAGPNGTFSSTLICRKIKKADWLADD